MAQNQTGKVHKTIGIAGIFILAILVAARFVSIGGNDRNILHLEDSAGEVSMLVQNGLLVIQKDRWISWNPPGDTPVFDSIYEIQLKCKWVGQIFFSVGDTETYLLFSDVKDFIPDVPFSLRLSVEEKMLVMRLVNSDQVLRQVPIAPEMKKAFKIRSSQSDFAITSLAVIDKKTGSIVAKETFGPDFKFSRIVPLAILFLCGFFLLQWIDSKIWTRFIRQDKESLRFSFTTALLPLAFGYLLLSRSTLENMLDNLALATIALRVFLVFSTGRGKKKLQTDKRGWVWLAAAMAPGLWALSDLAKGANLVQSPLWIILCSVVLVGITLLFALLLQKNRKADTLNPLRLCAQIWAFPAAGSLILLFQDDEEPAVHLLSFFLLMLFFIGLRFIQHVRKNLHFAQPLTLLLFVLAIVASEGTVRYADYATRFRPMNMGKDFEQNEFLFWAPKDLFARVAPHQPVSDFQVQKVRFRSGETSLEKPEGTFRIMTLGGSNTWGQWIDDPEKTWSGKLEAILSARFPERKIEVINAGVKGYNSFQLLILYRKYLAQYDPDLIVLYININDRAAHERKGMYTYRELYNLRTDGNWDDLLADKGIKTGAAKPNWIAGVQRFFQHSALYNGMTKMLLSFRDTSVGKMIDPKVARSLNPIEDYKANLTDFIRIAQDQGHSLVLADEFTFFGDDMEKKEDIFQTTLRQVARENDVYYFPAHEFLADHFKRSTLVFAWDPVHLNETGHQALAKSMADFIVEQIQF